MRVQLVRAWPDSHEAVDVEVAPGARVDFSEARLDVPRAAKQISVGWVQGDN